MSQSVVLYRMILPDHVCPYGVMSKQLLDGEGIAFEDKILRSREEVDAFEAEHGVDTTPQCFVDGERIGGTEQLERWLESRTSVSPQG
jgi:glutaredoxin 3